MIKIFLFLYYIFSKKSFLNNFFKTITFIYTSTYKKLIEKSFQKNKILKHTNVNYKKLLEINGGRCMYKLQEIIRR